MKKLLLGVMLFALVITSCNKYANDFQELKDQIAALSLKVDGVAALQAQLTSTTAQITALQAAVAALPNVASITALQTGLNTANGKIADIQTALNKLATDGATAASVTALAKQLTDMAAAQSASDLIYKAKFEALQASLDKAATSADLAKARQDLLDAINASASGTTKEISDLQKQIQQDIKDGTADTNGKIDELSKLVNDLNDANAKKIAEIIDSLGKLQNTADLTAKSVEGLVTAMNKAQTDLTLLLNATAMYNDNVTVTTDAEVDFYMAKLYQMGIINGNVLVNTDGISDAKIKDVRTIVAAIMGVIGTNESTLVINGGNHHWGGAWTISTIPGSGHWVAFESANATDKLDAVKLFSIRGDYTVTGYDVTDLKIDNVGGTVTLDYPGVYESTSLKTVGANLILVNRAGETTNINIPNVSIGGFVGDGTGAVNGGVEWSNLPTVTPAYAGTTSINLGLLTGGINNLKSTSASTISIGTDAIAAAGLVVTAPIATTVTLLATKSAGLITIATGLTAITGTATTVDLAKLVTSGPLTVWAAKAGTVKLDALNTVSSVSLRGPETVSIPVWEGNPGASLNAPETKWLTLATYRWWSVAAPATIPTALNLAVVETLTLGNALENVNIGTYQTLKKVVITGAAFVDATHPADHWATIDTWHKPGVSTLGNANLTWLELNGVMNTVNVTTLPKLTAVATSGVINTLILDNAAILVSAGLAHEAYVGATGFGGPGSDLWITNNAKLADLKPSKIDWLHTLKVTGNPSLASFNFSSYTKQLFSQTTCDITINAPAVMGTYVHSIAPISAGNAGIQAILTSADIMTLKPYLVASLANIHVNAYTFNINIGILPATTLAAVMTGDQALWGFSYTNYVRGFSPLAGSSAVGVPAAGVTNLLSIVQ